VFKQIICFFLIFSFVSSQSSKLLIFVNFKINQDLITALFCINKEKPKLKCNGKCHLVKQLKTQEDKKEEAPNNTSSKNEVLFCQNNTILNSIDFRIKVKEKPIPTLINPFKNKELIKGIFRPPQSC